MIMDDESTQYIRRRNRSPRKIRKRRGLGDVPTLGIDEMEETQLVPVKKSGINGINAGLLLLVIVLLLWFLMRER